MEKHRCKLCSKSFSNGRALGGHMKSHLVASQPTRKRLSESQHDSSASSSSSSFGDPDGKSSSYGLRENPRKSFRVADPGFSFANLDSGSSSVVVVDAPDEVEESETESEPANPVRKRVRKSGGETRRERSKKTKKRTRRKTRRNSEEPKKKKAVRNSNCSTTESPEPASSVSNTSPEKDLAMCLIMLSRDARKRDMKLKKPVSEKSEEAEEDMKPEKLRRSPIDLNLPPPGDENEACSVGSTM